MEIDTILAYFMNGDPLHDAIALGIVFTVLFEFYKVLFSTIMTPFKR